MTAMWIWSERCRVADEAAQYRDLLDGVEIQVPGALLPDDSCLAAIARCAGLGLSVTLAPLLPREHVAGKQHARTRIGFHADELEALDTYLGEHGASVDRVLCRVDGGEPPFTAIASRSHSPLRQIGITDWAVEFGDNAPDQQTARAGAALAAIATIPGARLFLEPLVDLDRTMDAPPGLLDRLCNPRPVFHAVRTLNTLLFADPTGWDVTAADTGAGDGLIRLHRGAEWLELDLDPNHPIVRLGQEDATPVRALVIDLEAGTSRVEMSPA